jgi:DNA-binding GntR family transcriptional regulator
MFDRQSPFLPANPIDILTVAEQKIRHEIVTGGVLPGERLSEQALCRSYRLGRGVVRSALNKLAHQGFVSPQPRSGWKVASITPVGLREITLARGQLEPLLADVGLSGEDLDRLEAICDMQVAVSSHAGLSSDQLSLLRSYDREIRSLLASRLKAPLIAAWLEGIWYRSDYYLNFLEASATVKLQPTDWTAFVAAKKANRTEEAAIFIRRTGEAFSIFAQARLLESDLSPPPPRKAKPKTTFEDDISLARSVRERPPSKRTL